MKAGSGRGRWTCSAAALPRRVGGRDGEAITGSRTCENAGERRCRRSTGAADEATGAPRALIFQIEKVRADKSYPSNRDRGQRRRNSRERMTPMMGGATTGAKDRHGPIPKSRHRESPSNE